MLIISIVFSVILVVYQALIIDVVAYVVPLFNLDDYRGMSQFFFGTPIMAAGQKRPLDEDSSDDGEPDFKKLNLGDSSSENPEPSAENQDSTNFSAEEENQNTSNSQAKAANPSAEEHSSPENQTSSNSPAEPAAHSNTPGISRVEQLLGDYENCRGEYDPETGEQAEDPEEAYHDMKASIPGEESPRSDSEPVRDPNCVGCDNNIPAADPHVKCTVCD